jgi:hypothetical protein
MDKNRERLRVAYLLFGIAADVSQLARAYLRGEGRGIRKNITQITGKLEKIRKLV